MAATLIPPPPTQETTETADALEAHVQRLLRSSHFARADTQRRLLEYLWQHRGENLNEYALAVEALGRGEPRRPASHDEDRFRHFTLAMGM